MSKNKNKLYSYLFHYNHHTQLWAAFKREYKEDYFNNSKRVNEGKVLYSKKVEDLIDFLSK